MTVPVKLQRLLDGGNLQTIDAPDAHRWLATERQKAELVDWK